MNTLKMDHFVASSISEILDNGVNSLGARPKYASDGKPANSKYITDVFIKFYLNKGELPISRLRPVYTGLARQEMLTIYQDQSNKDEDFKKRNVNWWTPWMNEEGNLNKSYAYNLESHPYEIGREIVEVRERKLDPKLKEPVKITVAPLEEKIIEEYKYFNLLKKLENRRYLIQDKRTGEIGFVSKNKLNSLANGEDILRDNGKGFEWLYIRKFYKIGYLGDYKKVNNFSEEEIEILKLKWINMLKRCYTEEYSSFYGNIWVHNRWHSFENFLRDMWFIPQFFLAKREGFKGWELDKDYYNSNFYSPETCVFLRSDENKSLSNYRIKAHNLESKQTLYFLNLESFVQTFGFNQGNASAVLRGKRKHIHGWTLEKEESKDGILYRKELSRNQVNNLLKVLEENPFSRRKIISFYQWVNQDKKMLEECAFQTIWDVREVNGEMFLDMSLIQRSSDFLIAGMGINQIQYVALQMMVAKHFGWKVGTFSWHVMNLHIYDRYFAQAQELVARFEKMNQEEQEEIEFYLNVPDKTNFYDIKPSDFVLKGYSSVGDQMKFDMAI